MMNLVPLQLVVQKKRTSKSLEFKRDTTNQSKHTPLTQTPHDSYVLKPFFFGGSLSQQIEIQNEPILQDARIRYKIIPENLNKAFIFKQDQKDRVIADHTQFLIDLKRNKAKIDIPMKNSKQVQLTSNDQLTGDLSNILNQDVKAYPSSSKLEKILLQEKHKKIILNPNQEMHKSPLLEAKQKREFPVYFQENYRIVSRAKKIANLAGISTIQALKIDFATDLDVFKKNSNFKKINEMLNQYEKLISEQTEQVEKDTLLYAAVKIFLKEVPIHHYQCHNIEQSGNKNGQTTIRLSSPKLTDGKETIKSRSLTSERVLKTKMITNISAKYDVSSNNCRSQLNSAQHQREGSANSRDNISTRISSFRTCCAPHNVANDSLQKFVNITEREDLSPSKIRYKIANNFIRDKLTRDVATPRCTNNQYKDLFGLSQDFTPLTASRLNYVTSEDNNKETSNGLRYSKNNNNNNNQSSPEFSDIASNAIDCIEKVWRDKFHAQTGREQALNLAFTLTSPKYISEQLQQQRQISSRRQSHYK